MSLASELRCRAWVEASGTLSACRSVRAAAERVVAPGCRAGPGAGAPKARRYGGVRADLFTHFGSSRSDPNVPARSSRTSRVTYSESVDPALSDVGVVASPIRGPQAESVIRTASCIAYWIRTPRPHTVASRMSRYSYLRTSPPESTTNTARSSGQKSLAGAPPASRRPIANVWFPSGKSSTVPAPGSTNQRVPLSSRTSRRAPGSS
jgi:hypothetical protein